MFNPLMLSRCDRLEMLSHVRQRQPPYRLDQRIAFLPYLSFPMMRKFVLRSTIVRMALLSLSTMKPISQSPNRLPSASLGRSCMFTLFLMPRALVSCLYRRLWRYLILCRQFAASVPFALLRIIL